MRTTRFLLLLGLVAVPLAGCKGLPDVYGFVANSPTNRTPDPNDSYDPYGLLGATPEADSASGTAGRTGHR